ncbi:MAG: site-2 protease family protein [Gemmataceae bacterium]
MMKAFSLGRAFGIPIYIHSSFLLLPLLALLLQWSNGVMGLVFSQLLLAAVFACVLLHELGHALMGRLFGIVTRDITLYPIGGVARMESTGRKPFEEVCISLAGPAVNLFILLLLSPLVAAAALSGLPLNPASAVDHGPLALLGSYLASLWVANLMLVAFNLMPVFPMDGGRVLRAILSTWLGALRATELAAALALVLAVVMGLAGLLLGAPTLILVAVFVIFAGQMELHGLRHHQASQRLQPVETVQVVAPLQAGGFSGFTGLAWDPAHRVWVRWVNGHPVEVHHGN